MRHDPPGSAHMCFHSAVSGQAKDVCLSRRQARGGALAGGPDLAALPGRAGPRAAPREAPPARCGPREAGARGARAATARGKAGLLRHGQAGAPRGRAAAAGAVLRAVGQDGAAGRARGVRTRRSLGSVPPLGMLQQGRPALLGRRPQSVTGPRAFQAPLPRPGSARSVPDAAAPGCAPARERASSRRKVRGVARTLARLRQRLPRKDQAAMDEPLRHVQGTGQQIA